MAADNFSASVHDGRVVVLISILFSEIYHTEIYHTSATRCVYLWL